jgi:predicted lipid-binding transport protein (Tim44 family)
MRAWVSFWIGRLRVSVPVTIRRRPASRRHTARRAVRPPVPAAHHVANGMVLGGIAGMLGLGVVAPPVSAVALLVAVAGLVMMVIQTPARMRRYRQLKDRRESRDPAE